MTSIIHHCTSCNRFTLDETCICDQATSPILPPKYSPDDRHSHLTRQAKETVRKKRGIL